MSKYFPILLLMFAILLASCSSPDSETDTAVADSTPAESGGMGPGMPGMGMGSGMNGMMARHQAEVPEEFAGLTNPVPADEASLARGEEIYTTYCTVCHGESGLGDGAGAANLDPAPAPIAHTARMLGDDYLYWRISEGGSHDPFNSAMPAWESAFDETARWDVINYIRALGGGMGMMNGNGMMGNQGNGAQMEDQTEMLATAVADGLITQAEADTFAEVHSLMDELMTAQMPMSGGMGQNQSAMLADLLDTGKITQEQVDTFNDVHDRLIDAGLMQ